MAGGNPYSFDMGGVIAQVDAIQTARMRQDMARNALAQEEEDRAWKREDRARAVAAENRALSQENALSAARGAAFSGQAGGIAKLATLKPGEAIQMLGYFEGKDEKARAAEIAAAKAEVEQMGKIAAWVKGAGDPQAQAQRYATARQNLPDLADDLPEQFDPNFVDFAMAQAMDLDAILEAAGSEKSSAAFRAALGGMTQQPDPELSDTTPMGGTGPASFARTGEAGGAAAFSAGLARTESGGNYGVQNSEGYAGKYQFGDARLDDYQRATGQKFTKEEFRLSPGLQENVQAWHVSDIDQFIRQRGYDRFIGQSMPDGTPITLNGMRAAAHLGGKGGLAKFIESGGEYNPADSNGTSLTDYMRTHAGGEPGGTGPVQPQQQEQPGIDQRQAALMALYGDPNTTDPQREMLKQMLEGMQPAAPQDRYRNVGDNLVDLTAQGGPQAVDFGAGQQPNFTGEEDMRKEVSGLPIMKDFQAQTSAMGRIVASAQDPSAAGDLALIFSFMKMLDPGSVVREQEFANAQNAAGVPDQIRNLYNRVISGERLNPDQRADFTSRAQALYGDAQQQVEGVLGQYRGIAQAQGMDPSRALIDFGYQGQMPPTQPAPAAGAGPQQIQSVDQYHSLPSGAQYVDPTGKVRTKR